MTLIRDFLMPDLGEGLESVEIIEWKVEVGEHVDLNQEICDVETAKAVVSIPCPFAGTVVERFGEVGDQLDVGSTLLRIDTGTEASLIDSGDEEGSEPDAPESVIQPVGDSVGAGDDVEAVGQSVLVGYGSVAETRERRSRQRSVQHATSEADGGIERRSAPLAKPPVRKLAKDLDVDLADLAPGSGEGGLVTRRDVLMAAEGSTRSDITIRQDSGGGVSHAPLRLNPGDVIPVRGIRRRTMAKMVESRTRIPEASTSLTVDCTETWDLAGQLTDQAQSQGTDIRITPFSIVMRAAVVALRRFPVLNSALDEETEEIRLLEPIHLGIAVDTERGLLVPVIKDADQKSTLEIAFEATRLIQAAREGSITPAELTQGTFTVNNYGALGTDSGEPIINYPEAGLLGVGAMKQRPWVVEGNVVPRRTVTLTLAFDHRICDGGDAARFVSYLGSLLENPARALLHL